MLVHGSAADARASLGVEHHHLKIPDRVQVGPLVKVTDLKLRAVPGPCCPPCGVADGYRRPDESRIGGLGACRDDRRLGSLRTSANSLILATTQPLDGSQNIGSYPGRSSGMLT